MTMQSPMTTLGPTASGGWGLYLKFGELTWWIWASIAALLIAGLAGYEAARFAAMVIAAVQALVWLARHGSLFHFPTQVRVTYAVWMAASFVPVLTAMFWIQAAGTVLLVLFGYCPLARLLLFLPVNRKVSLTLQRAARIVFHPPTPGSVLEDLKL